MKKLYSFLAGIVAIILVLWGIATHLDSKINSRDSQKLVIYNWGDYIDPELLEQFTEETGIQVQYETFDSNEAMYTKIKQGGTTYDIAIPSGEHWELSTMKPWSIKHLSIGTTFGSQSIKTLSCSLMGRVRYWDSDSIR